MANQPEKFIRFWRELNRRRVFRGIIAYGASALIILEAVTNIYGAFGIEKPPIWIIWVLGFGFIVSLWFSWIYDITPSGIKKTGSTSGAKIPIRQGELRTYKTTTFLSIVIIIGLLSFKFIERVDTKRINRLEKRIAVLPFNGDNSSPEEKGYFDFIGCQINSLLSNINDYTVIPWNTTDEYSWEEKDYSLIGEELSASFFVEYKPVEIDNQKQLTVNLISINGKLLWSKNFTSKGSWLDITKYSSKISKRVAKNLKTFLSLEERDLISRQPKVPLAALSLRKGDKLAQDAWEMVQTGNVLIDSTSFTRAIDFYTNAIELDSTFAEAYANRARTRLWGLFTGNVEGGLTECQDDIDRAYALNNSLLEADIAQAFYYYYGKGDYKMALEYFNKSADAKPDNSECLFYLSLIQRRLGDWGKVGSLTERVIESNPQNALMLTNIGISYIYMHDYESAIQCYDRAIELNRTWDAPYIHKIRLLILKGDLSNARRIALEGEIMTGNSFNTIIAELDLYEGNFSDAVKNIENSVPSEFADRGEAILLKAKIHKYAGNLNRANYFYNSAVDYYIDLIQSYPGYPEAYSRLGISYAGINDAQKAVYFGMKSLELALINRDAMKEPDLICKMAQIYALIGDKNSCVELINVLAKMESAFTLKIVDLDPYFNTIKEHYIDIEPS